MKKILSFVGKHPVKIFADCEFDSSQRKYVGGRQIAQIEWSGRMLSAQFEQTDGEAMEIDGVQIPTKGKQIWTSVDPIPPQEECDFCIVSVMYLTACQALGLDTSRLLTIGGAVVDEEGRVCGCTNLVRN